MNALDQVLNTKFDAVLDLDELPAPWPSLAKFVAESDGRLHVVVVPDMACEFFQEAERSPGGISLAQIIPDMPDHARREVSVELRAGTVDVLFVTPERFAQQKFVRFMLELNLRLIAITSAQRCCEDEFDYCPSYDALRTLRTLFPEVPMVALVECSFGSEQRHSLAAGLRLRLAPGEDEQASFESPTINSAPEFPVQSNVVLEHSAELKEGIFVPHLATDMDGEDAQEKVVLECTTESSTPTNALGWERAFHLFQQKKGLAEVEAALDEDEPWCVEALVAYIGQTGITKPFPWVDQPTYLTVAMVAGQAETNDPAMVLPILGDQVPVSKALLVLAALRNRALARPGDGS